MLLGREAECARIDGLLEDARSGRSGALLIRGDAGIGKTVLCEYACGRAGDLTVLRCRGMESESELAFAALGDLFRPVLDRLGAIPEPQRAALAGALAIGPPVARDRYTVCAATFGLLAAVAEERPVLAVVDNAQWLDASSAETLLFAVRRLESEGVATIVAARTGEAPLFEQAGLPELTVGGLDRETAAALLQEALERKVAAGVLERLHEATGGNPLALLEAAGALEAQQLSGAAPLPGPLPPGPTIERAVRGRVASLPEPARHALVVAAACESGEAETVLRALGSLGVEPARAALETAESAGFLVLVAVVCWLLAVQAFERRDLGVRSEVSLPRLLRRRTATGSA